MKFLLPSLLALASFALALPSPQDASGARMIPPSLPPPKNGTSTIYPHPHPTWPHHIPRPTSYKSCGGFRVVPQNCDEGYICVDDPYRGGCGMACDMPGICVKPQFCGGFAGFRCKGKNPMGKTMGCYDDPRDDCDPMNGGADCGGICI